MKIVFMGTTEFSKVILSDLMKSHEVVLVVTQPDRPFGRKQIMKPTPVKELALLNQIPVFQPEKIKADYQPIIEVKPEVIVVAAFGQMIPKIILDYPKYKAINVHASLLPKYRGGSPMHTAIKNGDAETGVTIMYMAPKMDAGSMLMQKSMPIEYTDNVGTIESKLAVLGSNLLLETLELIRQDKLKPTVQDESLVTFAWNIKPEEERLDFNKKSLEIYNHVRGFNPWPVAHFTIDSTKIKVLEVSVIEDKSKQYDLIAPGTIADIIKGDVFVKTLDGIIQLKLIQPAGKNVMDMRAFMNGSGKTLFYIGKQLNN